MALVSYRMQAQRSTGQPTCTALYVASGRSHAALCARGHQPMRFQKSKNANQGSMFQHSWSHRMSSRGKMVISAAIFGVGAPEALLVGVVALVVFGPKGLAQAVKSLGATLKSFSPTLRELASVTNDLSSTLQEQIGLDDIRNEFRNSSPSSYRSPSSWNSSEASTSSSADKQADSSVKKVEDEDLQAKIEESKRMAWGDGQPSSSSSVTREPGSSSSTASSTPRQKDGKEERPAAAAATTNSSPSASDFSIEELEAELKRRRETAK